MSSLNHASQSGADNIHEFAVRSESDPGAIGAGKGWLKLSTGELKARNATDDGWVSVGAGTGLSDHLADTTDAHDASAVSFAPAGTVAATNVQTAIEEVATEASAGGTGLSDHLADATDAHDASAISYAGSTDLSSTNVEAALDELDTEKASATSISDHLADTTDAHDASAVSFAPAGTIAATNVQAAIEEVASEAPGTVPTLSETVEGKGEAATDAEMTAGTDDTKIATAKKVKTFGDSRYVVNAGGLGTTINLDNLGDVDITSPATDDVLTFDGTDWTNQAGGGGGGGGYTPPWVKTGSGVLYPAWGDANPNVAVSLYHTAQVQPTPNSVQTTVIRCVKFRLPKALSVTDVYVFGATTVTGIYTLGIYPVGFGSSRVWQSGAITTATGWFDVTANTPFSLAADTDYWMCLGANAAGTSSGLITPATHTGNTVLFVADATAPFGGQSIGIPSVVQFATTGGAMPSTLPGVVTWAAGTNSGSVPICWLKGTAS